MSRSIDEAMKVLTEELARVAVLQDECDRMEHRLRATDAERHRLREANAMLRAGALVAPEGWEVASDATVLSGATWLQDGDRVIVLRRRRKA